MINRRRLDFPCRRIRAGAKLRHTARIRAGTSLAAAFRSPGRPIPGRRRDRRGRPHPRQPALGGLGPADGDREQGRRRQQYRRRDGRPLRSRRLHRPDQPLPISAINRFLYRLARLRCGRRLRAGLADLPAIPISWWSRTPRRPSRSWSSSPTPRRTAARSPSPRPAPAPRRICPASCSSAWPASR